MQISNIAITPPNRPRVKRMSQRDLQETQISNEFDSRSFSLNNRRGTRISSQVAPEMYNSWRPSDAPARNLDDDDKKCFVKRSWLWIFGGVFCLILVIAIIAIVLGIILPMTTTAAPDATVSPKMIMVDSVTSATMTCSSSGRGLIAYLNGSTPSGWTSYSYNYSATKTVPTVMFGFETDALRMYYLDNVYVVDNSVPSIELLINPSFENSTTNATGWLTSCESSCGAAASQIVSGSQCSGSSGNCFMARCVSNDSSISVLSQSFVATIGNTYIISYMLNQAGSSSTGIMSFYFDIS